MTEYPRIKELDIALIKCHGFTAVKAEDVHEKIGWVLGEKSKKQFDTMFGCQTCPVLPDGSFGMFAWDTEDVLERMISGRKQGTQSSAGWD